MRRTASCAIAFLCAFQAAPAQAQSRVFVAAQGSDANACTFALPCRSFQHAHDVVAANGEIDVLDPAGYGALIINKAISIQGHGFAGIAATGGATAITINAGANDKVSLRGLLIDGVGTGLNGITFNTGGSLDIQECLVRNFTNVGIDFSPGGTSTLVISDTRSVSNIGNGTNQAAGIVIGGPGTASGALDHVIIENNGDVGLAFEGTNAATNFFVSNSVIWNNGFRGIAVIGLNPNTIILWNVAVSNHFSIALDANGPGAVVRITKSAITGNNVGMNPLNGAQIISGGDNFIDGNGADGAPTSTVGLK